jgi:hypothetical protein
LSGKKWGIIKMEESSIIRINGSEIKDMLIESGDRIPLSFVLTAESYAEIVGFF